MRLMYLFIIYIVSCNITVYSMGAKKPALPVIELPPITVTNGDYLTVKKCTNCSEKQWKFIQVATIKTNETIASTCFSSFMLQRKLIDTASMNNAQVIDRLVGKNTETDVEMYYSLKRVLGYTYGNQPIGKYKIWINSRYMMEWNYCDLGSLLGHETSHKKGFSHSYKYTPSRDYSVPYSINAAFKQCCVR